MNPLLRDASPETLRRLAQIREIAALNALPDDEPAPEPYDANDDPEPRSSRQAYTEAGNECQSAWERNH